MRRRGLVVMPAYLALAMQQPAAPADVYPVKRDEVDGALEVLAREGCQRAGGRPSQHIDTFST